MEDVCKISELILHFTQEVKTKYKFLLLSDEINISVTIRI